MPKGLIGQVKAVVKYSSLTKKQINSQVLGKKMNNEEVE